MSENKTTDYYALLEVRADASNMDIINAYRRAKLTYKTDSMATYSLFDDIELDQIRAEIEQAYQTLSNPEKRRDYDAELAAGSPSRLRSGDADHSPTEGAASQDNVVDLAAKAQASSGIRLRLATATVYPGALLKEIREYRGVALAAIAERTKISKRYLQAIEEEDSRHLPEPIYLKGYLKQYAAEIGLDPERVAAHYPPLQPEGSESG
jgi:curved DNA-binding protein CbpA